MTEISMNRIICFQKNAKTIEEYLKQIEMSDVAKKPLRVVDEIPTGYEDPRWIEKSNSIKARDNFTCQLCHAFNPMQDGLIFIQQGEYETYHHYYWDGISRYEIHVKGYLLTINIDFYPGFHLAMPRLNVHHKIYYRNRNLWDYDDDCLVTLCEDCHHYIHSLNNICIPIVEELSDGNTILVGKTKPKSYQPILNHTDLGTFIPLTIVKENKWGLGLNEHDLAQFRQAKVENKQWFDYQKIIDNKVLSIHYFMSCDPQWNKHTLEETKEAKDFIIKDFIESILGYSKTKQ